MTIKGRKCHGRSSGLFLHRKAWGNLPEGEGCLAPIEGTTNGTFVIDGSVARLGKVDKPIKVVVEKGYAVSITGGSVASMLKNTLKPYGHKALNIAELGIGTNPKAKITGEVLEDEKVLGTCHFAFGNNKSMEGKIDVPLHIDCVIRKPTIKIDSRLIMKNGKLLL
jgi:aminopeptidase